MKKLGKLRAVSLSHGRLELVPAETVLLNPYIEGRRAHVWGVWAFDSDAPCDLAGAAGGKRLGPLMAYLSDRDDLWKLGQSKPARYTSEEDAEDCRAQAAELLTLALRQIDEADMPTGRAFVIAWALFDMAAKAETIPMGTSLPLAKSRGSE